MRIFFFFTFFFLTTPVFLKADVDDDFVTSKLSKIDKLIAKGEFVDGQIYKNNDTINTLILQFSKKDSKLFHFLCIEKKEDELVKHFVDDIGGFMVLEDLFIKIHFQNKTLFHKKNF